MLKNLVELVKEEDFDSFLKSNQDKLVLVKFSAGWCPPCQVLQRNIEELLRQPEEQHKGLVVLKVDAEKFPQLVSKEFDLVLSVRSVPTFFLVRQGRLIKEERGSR